MSRRYQSDKKKEKDQKNGIYKKFGITVGVIIAVYIGIALFFSNRYLPGTTIEGTDCGFKTVDQVKELLSESIKGYSIQVIGRDYRQETITADQVNLTFYDDGTLAQIKADQPAESWISGLFEEKEYTGYAVSVDDAALKKAVLALNMTNKKNMIKAQDAKLKYDYGTDLMAIKSEKEGTQISAKKLMKGLKEAIIKRQPSFDANAAKCYKEAKLTADSKVLKQNVKKLNKFCKAEIIYDFDDREEVVDGSVICDWVYIDDNYNARLDEDDVIDYVVNLSNKYDTVGMTRKFKSLSGNNIEVSGGTYGWEIDREEEIDLLYSQIRDGKKVRRSPKYSHIAKSRKVNDVGDTYVEVDLASQYVWCFVDGKEMTEGPCVTGCTSLGRDTPSGSFYVLGKDTQTYLTGANYRSFVNYWMPFTDDGVGLHDAPWRGDFGGSIYVYGGSHGCVNLPYSLAQEIFNTFEATYPVIVHW